jgi:hypothetical protein
MSQTYQTLPGISTPGLTIMNQTGESFVNSARKAQQIPQKKEHRQVKLYEKAFAQESNMSGFLMSDNFFLKKITTRLNEAE